MLERMKELPESPAAGSRSWWRFWVFAIRYCLWRESKKAQAVPIITDPGSSP
jgi:hypothetical protein